MSKEPTSSVSSEMVGTELSYRETAWCHARRGRGQDTCVLLVTVVQPGVDEGLDYRHAMGRAGNAMRNF